jgi:hypothetical protein
MPIVKVKLLGGPFDGLVMRYVDARPMETGLKMHFKSGEFGEQFYEVTAESEEIDDATVRLCRFVEDESTGSAS